MSVWSAPCITVVSVRRNGGLKSLGDSHKYVMHGRRFLGLARKATKETDGPF